MPNLIVGGPELALVEGVQHLVPGGQKTYLINNSGDYFMIQHQLAILYTSNLFTS